MPKNRYQAIFKINQILDPMSFYNNRFSYATNLGLLSNENK